MKIAEIAGAPISWGVCEVPGWGYQLQPDRVLTEMRGAGLTATELGPEGFLPSDTDELKAVLRVRAECVGGFVPVVLFEDDHDPAGRPRRTARVVGRRRSGCCGARRGHRIRRLRLAPVLDDAQWATLLANLDRLAPSSPTGVCSRCCIRTSARWSRPAPTSTGFWPGRRSRCAWTPVTC